MKSRAVYFLLSIFALSASAQTLVPAPSPSVAPQMNVPEGQLRSSPIRVYVSPTNLDDNVKPQLQLAPFKGWTKDTSVDAFAKHDPKLVAPNQSWIENVAGENVQRHGTLMIFDLSEFPIARYKASTRVIPILTWQSTGGDKGKIVGQAIYLGNFWPAVGWTLITMIVLLRFIRSMAKKTKPSSLYLLAGPDNYMSLWRTQLAAWTIAVGSMVFLFGIIQLKVPRIPDSLVALMGLSIATGSLSAVADKTKSQKMAQAAAASAADLTQSSAAPTPAEKPRLFHLISSYDPSTKSVLLSIPKAQMVFWTGIILILFVLKSWLTGELWEVPWELVTLTGVSQAGYITDKAVETSKA
jgi:hypothetical protein